MRLGRTLLHAGELEEGSAVLAEALRADPDLAKADELIALAEMMRGRWEAAAARLAVALQRAERCDPKHTRKLGPFACDYLNRGPVMVTIEVDLASQVGPDLARQSHLLRRLRHALSMAQHRGDLGISVARWPAMPPGHLPGVRVLEAVLDAVSGLRSTLPQFSDLPLERLARFEPFGAVAFYYTGLAMIERGYGVACGEFTRALELAPDAGVLLAACAAAAARYDRPTLEADLARAIQLSPDDPRVLLLAARTRMGSAWGKPDRDERMAKAILDLQRADRLAPDQPLILRALVEAMMERGIGTQEVASRLQRVGGQPSSLLAPPLTR